MMNKQQVLEELTKREKDCSAAESSAHNRQNYDFATNMHGHAAAYRQAIQLVEKLDAWTNLIDDKGRPVEGALPKYHTPVLVSVYYLGVGSRVFKADCDTLGIFTDHRGSELGGTVYAWMPLPAAAPYPVREEE